MSHEDLQELVRRRPFHPLRLFISDGRTYDLRHPDQVIVAKRSVVVGLTKDPADHIPDRFAWVDLLQIARVEPLETSGQIGNGEQA